MRFVYGALLFAWSATAAFSLSPPVAAGLIILLAGTILPLIKQNTPPFGKQAVLLLLGWTFVLYLVAGWLSFAISGLFLLLALIAIKAPLHAAVVSMAASLVAAAGLIALFASIPLLAQPVGYVAERAAAPFAALVDVLPERVQEQLPDDQQNTAPDESEAEPLPQEGGSVIGFTAFVIGLLTALGLLLLFVKRRWIRESSSAPAAEPERREPAVPAPVQAPLSANTYRRQYRKLEAALAENGWERPASEPPLLWAKQLPSHLHAMQEAALMYEKVRYSSATLTKKEAALFRKAVTEVKQAMQDETRFT
ncbi:DUF4129 domain-containing protein [Bacillus daqingensis]|uniref:DUF4129 domain-containing protein n=1 Tax=Bacillus daqingensis TaxID=872396 RepID=A0ABV9NVL5_9BACI